MTAINLLGDVGGVYFPVPNASFLLHDPVAQGTSYAALHAGALPVSLTVFNKSETTR